MAAAKPLVSAWSYSRYADYKQCPLKFKLKHIDRLKEPGSAAMDRGSAIHKAGEDYLLAAKTPKSVPPQYKDLEAEIKYLRDNEAIVEQAWGFKNDWSWIGRSGWFGDDVWFRAKADALVLYEDNTALLVDWKSGKKHLGNEDQVNLFALAAFKRYPELTEVDTRLWYTDAPADDNEIQFVYSVKSMPAIQKDWDKRVQPMFNDRKFAPTPNQRCGWCHFRKENGGPCKF